MNKKLVLLGGVLCLLVASKQSEAGLKSNGNVSISTTNRTASGSLGSARNSSDGVQYIECFVTAGTSGVAFGSCAATNTSGTHVYCSSNSSGIIDQIRAMNGDDRVQFYYNASGECTLVTLTRSSRYAPKAV